MQTYRVTEGVYTDCAGNFTHAQDPHKKAMDIGIVVNETDDYTMATKLSHQIGHPGLYRTFIVMENGVEVFSEQREYTG